MNTTINQFVVKSIQINLKHQPVAVFLLGANGSGKSSLRSYLDLADIQTNIDPDALNRIAKLRYHEHHLLFASKQAIKLYKNAIENGLNVCMESTFSGQSIIQRVNLAKCKGYYVQCYFMGLSDVNLNIERVKQRVLRGGHDIDQVLIEKRFTESVDNLVAYSNLFDELHVIDNSDEYYRVQFSCYQGRFVLYEPMEAWAKNIHQRLQN